MSSASRPRRNTAASTCRPTRRSSTRMRVSSMAGVRQDDSRLRQPHPLRRAGHAWASARAGRSWSSSCCSNTYDVADPGGRAGLAHRHAAATVSARTTWRIALVRRDLRTAALSTTGFLNSPARALPACRWTIRNGIDVMTTETTCLSSIWADRRTWCRTHYADCMAARRTSMRLAPVERRLLRRA